MEGLPELLQPQCMPPCPTPWSNWVIPGRVLAGAYPASQCDAETEKLLTTLLQPPCGVTTFVCLQAEVNIHVPDHSWRAGLALRPYIRDAQRLLSRAQAASASSAISQRRLDFLHLPIVDGSVTTDAALSRLADDCCERIVSRGECLYIHCWGGHGRTGTLVATMLGRLYCLPYTSALSYTQAYHDLRQFPQGVRSPQTSVQRAQVKRLLLQPNAFAAAVKRTQQQQQQQQQQQRLQQQQQQQQWLQRQQQQQQRLQRQQQQQRGGHALHAAPTTAQQLSQLLSHMTVRRSSGGGGSGGGGSGGGGAASSSSAGLLAAVGGGVRASSITSSSINSSSSSSSSPVKRPAALPPSAPATPVQQLGMPPLLLPPCMGGRSLSQLMQQVSLKGGSGATGAAAAGAGSGSGSGSGSSSETALVLSAATAAVSAAAAMSFAGSSRRGSGSIGSSSGGGGSSSSSIKSGVSAATQQMSRVALT